MTYALYFSCRFNNSIQQLVLSVLFCLLNFPLYKNPSSGGRKRFHLLHVIEQKCKPFYYWLESAKHSPTKAVLSRGGSSRMFNPNLMNKLMRVA